MNYVAILPLRGGSKSIPLKNIKDIAGAPLYAWALKAALESNIFSQIIVSTDSLAIRQDVEARFPAVEIIERKQELATDTASSDAVLLDLVKGKKFKSSDIICLIQATSPLTKPEDFRAARTKFELEQADSLVTGVRWKRFFWDDNAIPINYLPQKRPRRQEFDGWIMENGAFYFTRIGRLLSEGHRLPGKVCTFEMHDDSSFELDEPSDWLLIESLLNSRTDRSILKQIKCVAFDIDGTLTDGGMYYDANGEFSKKFNTKDAVGLRKLAENGLKLAAITGEISPSVRARLAKMGINYQFEGVKDKVAVLGQWLEAMGLTWDQLAYIGDDELDVAALSSAGFAAAPYDAEKCVLRVSGIYITSRRGGHGAVRDFCEKILGEI